MLTTFRSLSVLTILTLCAYACSSSDSSTPTTETPVDGGPGTGSDGGAGGDTGTSPGSDSGTPPEDSGTPSAGGPTFIKVDGVLAAGTDTYANTNNGSGSGIEITIGSALGSDATFLLQVHTIKDKAAGGNFGIEAVGDVEAQLNVIGPTGNPKKGLYVTNRFNPATENDITFTMNEKDGNKLTFSWKGLMKLNGGTDTIEVDVGGTDLTLKQQQQN